MKKTSSLVLAAIAASTLSLACSTNNNDHPSGLGTPDTGLEDTARPDTSFDSGAPKTDATLDASDSDAAPTCTDKAMNGSETDVDCGGTSCPACIDGKHCSDPSHCTSKVCTGGVCIAPTCTDLVKNGTETDNDCGGGCATKCVIGKICAAATDCVSAVCTDKQCKCPVGMTIMPTAVLAGGNYCIDTNEVTYDSYVKFWTANPPLSTAQPAYCTSWNTSWTPTGAWPPDASGGAYPVRYVDWCDAYAYCKWAGKTLCGKLGGGTVAIAEATDHLKSQWYNACSAQGANVYPYSGSYSAGKCNGAGWVGTADAGVAGPQSTILPPAAGAGATAASCQGGAPGLYGMSGNVAEWEDACSGATGDTDTCLVRGGSWTSDSTSLRCDAVANKPTRNTTTAEIGFRCCYP